MSPRPPLRAGLATAALAALLLTGCTATDAAPSGGPSSASPVGSSAASPAPSSPVESSGSGSAAVVEGDAATVLRVVDGDTVDVDRGGEEVRVRLLNIDTPETKHPNKAVQCMGPEATRRLEELLERGDRVVLQYDEERTDRYGRTLAGVFEGGSLVNAEIARAGLGVPVVFEPNRRFYPEVVAAWNEAEERQAGLNQPNLECSLPVLASPAALGEVPPAEPVPPADLEGVGAQLAAAGATQRAVRTLRGALEEATSGDQPWMEALYADDLDRAKDTLSRYGRIDDHVQWLRAESQRREARGTAAPPTPSTPSTPGTQDRAEPSAAAAEQAAKEKAAAEEAAAEQAAKEQAARERAAEEKDAEQQAAAQAEARRRAAAQEQAAKEQEARERAAEEKAAAQAEARRKAAAEQAAQEQARREAAAEAAREKKEAAERGSGSSSSGGTSQKAPNRCYAPGGQTFTYCDEGGSSSGSSSGGSSSGGTSTGTARGSGGPVSGSGGVCPPGYPVKVSGSGKYHLPGGASYDDTGSKRCYASAAAAAADGAIPAKG